MSTCEVCHNDYEKSFDININGETHTFDCFECAISALAPTCAHCGCRVIGHGVEEGEKIFCCDHCLRSTLDKQSGVSKKESSAKQEARAEKRWENEGGAPTGVGAQKSKMSNVRPLTRM